MASGSTHTCEATGTAQPYELIARPRHLHHDVDEEQHDVDHLAVHRDLLHVGVDAQVSFGQYLHRGDVVHEGLIQRPTRLYSMSPPGLNLH
eukprot:1777066-Heterocapsa_arctica.AAC.1